MLDRLQRHAQQLDGYAELRWHANRATRLAMRKGALLQNSQSREGGVSARCYRSGAFGFASRPGDSDAAIVAALAQARANATLYERAVGGSPASLPRTEPGTGTYDYRSRRDPLSAGERTDLLRRLNDAVAQKYPGLLNADLVLSSLAIEKALVTSEGAATYSYVPRTSLWLGLSLQANDGPVQLNDWIGGLGDLQEHFHDLDPVLEWIDGLYQALREKAEGTHCDAGARATHPAVVPTFGGRFQQSQLLGEMSSLTRLSADFFGDTAARFRGARPGPLSYRACGYREGCTGSR